MYDCGRLGGGGKEEGELEEKTATELVISL